MMHHVYDKDTGLLLGSFPDQTAANNFIRRSGASSTGTICGPVFPPAGTAYYLAGKIFVHASMLNPDGTPAPGVVVEDGELVESPTRSADLALSGVTPLADVKTECIRNVMRIIQEEMETRTTAGGYHVGSAQQFKYLYTLAQRNDSDFTNKVASGACYDSARMAEMAEFYEASNTGVLKAIADIQKAKSAATVLAVDVRKYLP